MVAEEVASMGASWMCWVVKVLPSAPATHTQALNVPHHPGEAEWQGVAGI